MELDVDTCRLKLSEMLTAGVMIPETAFALKEHETGQGMMCVSMKS